jgi:DNA repair exonuclease SbcCD ATPase subunit
VQQSRRARRTLPVTPPACVCVAALLAQVECEWSRVFLTQKKCAVCSKQALELAEREVLLRGQMNTYSEKFQELQETLTKSNEVFSQFKKDSEKMQKRIKSSEKERLLAERLAQKNGKELADVTEKFEALKKESANLKKQKERMEMLCRTLTQERADLKDKLRALGALPGPDLTPGLASSDETSAASDEVSVAPELTPSQEDNASPE